MLLGISMIATSETMNLGVRMGMDPKLLAGILNTSPGKQFGLDDIRAAVTEAELAAHSGKVLLAPGQPR